jgi:glutaryl-CoA dehydrogenase
MATHSSWQKLNWQDPFKLEQQLTDEQRMVRDSMRRRIAATGAGGVSR